MAENDRATTPIVDAIEKINFAGNITPRSWYSCPLLKYPSGKTHLAAITLLADICYWYRPTEVLDERSGRVIARRRKFYGHRLEKNYADWGKEFGLSDREARDAIALLVKIGLIIREVQRPENRVFLEPIPDAIMAITFPDGSRVTPEREPNHVETGAALPQNGTRPTPERERTDTKSTSNKSTSKTTANNAAADSKSSLSEDEVAALVQSLIELRVESSAAQFLAAQYPERCRRYIPLWRARGFEGVKTIGGAVRDSIENPSSHWAAMLDEYKPSQNGSAPKPKPPPDELLEAAAATAFDTLTPADQQYIRKCLELEDKTLRQAMESYRNGEFYAALKSLQKSKV